MALLVAGQWIGLVLLGMVPAAPATLRIANPSLHQYEGGPPAPASQAFQAGDTVFISFQIAGYRATEKERVLLSWTIDSNDPAGVRLAETRTGKVDAELSPEDKAWMPKVRYSVVVPPTAPSGRYRLQVRVKDENAAADTTAEIPFTVQGRSVEPGTELVVRNFRFFRREEDGEPLKTPAYRPGDAVWARFDITGYKYGPGNRVEVDYGISVLRPGGEVMFSEPKAASEQRSSFYPARFVEGAASLKLDPDIHAGEYTILVTVRDAVGGQRCEQRAAFRIE